MGMWNDFTRFLSDVRAEMRKVVAPSRKEVQATTSVVIITVFLFGFFFFVVDLIFNIGLARVTAAGWADCSSTSQPRIESRMAEELEQPAEHASSGAATAGAQRALQVVHPARLLGL